MNFIIALIVVIGMFFLPVGGEDIVDMTSKSSTSMILILIFFYCFYEKFTIYIIGLECMMSICAFYVIYTHLAPNFISMNWGKIQTAALMLEILIILRASWNVDDLFIDSRHSNYIRFISIGDSDS